MNITWNAEKYTADFSFVHQYGKELLSLINKNNSRSVLDLGCGNGALSKVLYDAGFVVTGMDSSEELLKTAKKSYSEINFVYGDATDFILTEKADVVFSNAVFHWIDETKQVDMMHCVYNALKTKGQFVFELGGRGNNKLIHAELKKKFNSHGYEYKFPFYFPTIAEYSSLLESVGFKTVYAVLFERPTALKGNDGLKDWIHMFVKTPFDVIESDDEKETIIDEVVSNLKNDLYKDGVWYSDYVRLRMKAIKSDNNEFYN